nr:DNA (cytosine-5-)-methyltransferase [Rhizobium quercicola]
MVKKTKDSILAVSFLGQQFAAVYEPSQAHGALSDMKAATAEIDERTAALRKAIRAEQTAITTSHLNLVSIASELRAVLPEDDVRSFLSIECLVPCEDVQGIFDLVELARDHGDALKRTATSVSAMNALAGASPQTRQLALMRINLGHIVTAVDIRSIERRARKAELSLDDSADRRRLASLRCAARATAPRQIEALGDLVSDLIILIDEFVERDMPDPPMADDEVVDFSRVSMRFRTSFDVIRTQAKGLLGEFERIYGTDHAAPEMWKRAGQLSNRRALARAYESLKRFAAGRFADRGGMSFELGYPWRTDLRDALFHIARAGFEVTERERSDMELRVLELCAGAGGQAIGLHAAGFVPTMLYENNRNAAATLRKNWNWPVTTKNIKGIPIARFASSRGIDLVAGGLPCQPFSQSGDMNGPDDGRNLFDKAVEVVRAARPRAFFFENVTGFTGVRFGAYRASLFRRFKASGYDVQLHTIDAARFGVPQKRQRVVMVGFRSSAAARAFQMPVLDKPLEVTMGDALGDILFPYRSGAGQATTPYDSWADAWLDVHGKKLAPTVTGSPWNARNRIKKQWAACGIDTREQHEIQPTPEETAAGALPRFTPEVAKRLQGFPDQWEITGDLRSKFTQLGNAFPPRAATAVAAAIRSALTGEQIDLLSLLEHPPMPLSEIGVKKSRPAIDLNAYTLAGIRNLRADPETPSYELEYIKKVERRLRDRARRAAVAKNRLLQT